MSSNINISTIDLDDIQLDNYLDNINSGFFQTDYWKNYNRECSKVFLIAFDNNFIPILGIEENIKRKIFEFKKIRITDGINFDFTNNLNILEIFLKYLTKEYHVIEIELSFFNTLNHNNRVRDIFKENKFKHSKWGTYIIDLEKDVEKIFSNFSKNLRNKIRNSESKGLQIHQIKLDNLWNDYYLPYKLSEEEFNREMNISLEDTKKMKKYAKKNSLVHMTVLDEDKIFLASKAGHIFRNHFVQMRSTISKKAMKRKVAAQDLVTWELIKYSKSLGCNYYNLAGVNPNPTEKKEIGIKEFKSKFGGKYIEYDRYFYENSSFKLLDSLFQTLRKIKRLF